MGPGPEDNTVLSLTFKHPFSVSLDLFWSLWFQSLAEWSKSSKSEGSWTCLRCAKGWNPLFMMSTSSSDCDYSLWRHRNSCMSAIKFASELYRNSLWPLISVRLFIQVWDQGHTPRGGERSGEPQGQSWFPQLQATPLQYAGILRPHRPRHQRHAPLLPLSRHRVQTWGLQSGKLSFFCPFVADKATFFDRFLKFYILGRNKSVWESVLKRCVDRISLELSLESHTAHFIWCLNSCVQTTHFF